MKSKNFKQLTNNSIIETFQKIKKDKSPFSNKKITLTIYKEYSKKIKIVGEDTKAFKIPIQLIN